jgi:hypothetical protein
VDFGRMGSSGYGAVDLGRGGSSGYGAVDFGRTGEDLSSVTIINALLDPDLECRGFGSGISTLSSAIGDIGAGFSLSLSGL